MKRFDTVFVNKAVQFAATLMSVSRIIALSTLFLLAALAFPGLAETFRGREAAREWTRDFRVVPPAQAARMIREGRKVVFLDVRERAEYEEERIPGAILIPLRDLRAEDLARARQVDLVIPYCLKDFRGYEGARILRERGIRNVGLLEGFGLRAWAKAGLPVAGSFTGMGDGEALEKIK